MYNAHFGFSADPFSLSPDPAFLYQSPAHAEALAGLRIALQSRRGLATMIGEVGTGKTTLLYTLLRDAEPAVRAAYLANTCARRSPTGAFRASAAAAWRCSTRCRRSCAAVMPRARSPRW